MTEIRKRLHEQAEKAFAKSPPPRTARDRILDEINAIKVASEEKRLRLRQARLSKEAIEDASNLPVLETKPRSRRPSSSTS